VKARRLRKTGRGLKGKGWERHLREMCSGRRGKAYGCG